MRHLSFVDEVHFTTGRYSIVTFVRPDTVQFWNAPPTQAAFTILVHTSSVPAAFSSDGHSILTASSNIARVYDASTGQPVGPPIQNEGAIWHASFSPNGRRIVTTSTDHTARVWDATTAKPVSPPIKHNELIYFASFSPDGAFLATASHQTARVWDASTGQPISAPMQHDSDIVSASFSHDASGRLLPANLFRRRCDTKGMFSPQSSAPTASTSSLHPETIRPASGMLQPAMPSQPL